MAAGPTQKTKGPASFVQGLYDSDEFYPGSKKPLKIHVGDTVKFVGGFHTASILGTGVKRSSFFLIQPGAAGELYPTINDGANQPYYFSGQQKFIYNTATLGPSGGPNVSSKATTYNSGVLFASPKGYSMKFPKAGKYQIVCLIHPAMNGTVEVVAPSKKVDAPAKAAPGRAWTSRTPTWSTRSLCTSTCRSRRPTRRTPSCPSARARRTTRSSRSTRRP